MRSRDAVLHLGHVTRFVDGRLRRILHHESTGLSSRWCNVIAPLVGSEPRGGDKPGPGAGETAEGFAGACRTVCVGGRRSPSSDGVVTVLRQKGKELFPSLYQEEGPRIGKFMWQNLLSIVSKTTFGIYRSDR